MSYTGATGGAALSGLSSVASAGSSDGDGPTVGPDVVVTSPPGPSNTEWDPYITEFAYDRATVLPEIPNPGNLPIEKCYTVDDTDVCVSTSGEINIGTKTCGSSQTPKLYWTTMTVTETVDDVFQVEAQFWVGVSESNGCVYAGNESSGVCTTLGCNAVTQYENVEDGSADEFASHEDQLATWAKDNPDIVIGGATTGLGAVAAATGSGSGGGGIAFAAAGSISLRNA